MGAEIVQRMTNVLRLFNQKTYEFVLRAGAVQKGTLKRITAANLALSSQCCGLVAQVLPSLQANLLNILDVQGAASGAGVGVSNAARQAVAAMVGDLTKVATEYNDHRDKLYKRLSDLLKERYEVHAKKWLGSVHTDPISGEFGAAGVEIQLNQHVALEDLVRDIQNMYRVLLKSLTGENVKKIFDQAFKEMAVKFEQRLQQELPAPSPPYEDMVGSSLGDRLALDVAYLQEQLMKLSGIATPLRSFLADLLKHLQVCLPSSDPVRALHSQTLEALRRTGKLGT